MKVKMKVMVINLDNIDFTRDCLSDLKNQTTDDFEIVLVDQASTEIGTEEFLSSINDERITVIRNIKRKPLNATWNWFEENYDNELLCFLNNDVRLSTNFIESTIMTFEQELKVGIVCHTTNHFDYCEENKDLQYVIVEPNVNMQGWDFTIRKELYNEIPSYLKTYCGDDYLFTKVYSLGYDLAYVLNSPIIHYEGQSKKSMKTSGVEDIHAYKENNNEHYLKINYEFSNIKPTFNKIKNE